jgi:hypothetical protein
MGADCNRHARLPARTSAPRRTRTAGGTCQGVKRSARRPAARAELSEDREAWRDDDRGIDSGALFDPRTPRSRSVGSEIGIHAAGATRPRGRSLSGKTSGSPRVVKTETISLRGRGGGEETQGVFARGCAPALRSFHQSSLLRTSLSRSLQGKRSHLSPLARASPGTWVQASQVRRKTVRSLPSSAARRHSHSLLSASAQAGPHTGSGAFLLKTRWHPRFRHRSL